MIHNNKKGFTLVELLAVIVILGILLMIGNMSIDAIALRVRKNQHENLVKKIKVAAEKYFDDKSTTTVTVKDLIENGYISADNKQGNLKSPETGDDLGCHRLTLSDGSVTMDETCQNEGNIVSTNIKIVYCFGVNGTNCYSINDSKNDEWQNGVNKTSGVGSAGTIYLRAYMVSSGQLLSSGKFKWINPINPDKVVNDYYVSIPFGTENSGYYNELFQLTYEENDKEYTAQKQVMLDSIAPVCAHSGDSTTWTSNNRTIKKECKDTHSRCASTTQNEVFNKTTVTAPISAYDIYDKAGNKTTCNARTANVYVDKTSPTCSIKKDNLGTTSGVTTHVTCDDKNSGCSSSNTTGETGVKASKEYSVKDNVGNVGKCSVTITAQKQKRTCKSCSVCDSAPCKTYTTCATSACGYTEYYNCGKLEHSKKSEDLKGSCEQKSEGHDRGPMGPLWNCTCRNYKSCATATCGCSEYSSSCSDCGCSSWNSWQNETSCSSSSSVECRTLYS